MLSFNLLFVTMSLFSVGDSKKKEGVKYKGISSFKSSIDSRLQDIQEEFGGFSFRGVLSLFIEMIKQ